jgi:hypothetical protein
MNREKAREAIVKIFTAAGYDVNEGEGEFDLSAVGDDECIVVMCSNEGPEIERFVSTPWKVRYESGPAECTKLLFSQNASINVPGCIRWGEAELARFSGMAVISEINNIPLSLELGTRIPHKKELDSLGPIIPHLPVHISEERAASIANVEGTIKCRFVPNWFYHYKSTGEKVFKHHVISFEEEAKGAMSAVNGLETEIEFDMVEKSGIPSGSEVLHPVIQKKDAEEKIVSGLIEKLTRGVRTREVEGDTISYEDKIIKPDRKNITVELELVYVPVWQVRGKKIVEVNGYSGEILTEPMDDGVELL